MSNIKIIFNKEVEIDLNAYYPTFSKKLREEIDNAIYGLLGGTPPTQVKKIILHRRTDLSETTIFRRTKKLSRKPHSATYKVLQKLGQGEFLYADVQKAIREVNQGILSPASFIKSNYLEIVK